MCSSFVSLQQHLGRSAITSTLFKAAKEVIKMLILHIETSWLLLAITLGLVYKLGKLSVLSFEVKSSIPKYQDKGTVTFSMKN